MKRNRRNVDILNIATWNTRGLSKREKQERLGEECIRYNIDIAGIQETKVRAPEEKILKTKHKLIFLEQKESSHGGLGFIVSNKMKDNINSYKYINDRIATLDIVIQQKQSKTKMRIINAYAPTNEKVKKDHKLAEDFFSSLQTEILNTPSSWQLWILSDMNSRLVRKDKKVSTDEEENCSQNSVVGRYGYGKSTNENGEHLLEVLHSNELFAANTAFKHPKKHITTWTGYMRDPNKKTNSIPINAQIDFIICRNASKILLKNARSYGGAKLESDHKLVKAQIILKRMAQPKTTNIERTKKYQLQILEEHRYKKDFSAAVEDQLKEIDIRNQRPQEIIRTITKSLKNAQEQVLPEQLRTKSSGHSDSVLHNLIEIKNSSYLKLKSDNKSKDRTEQRRKINKLKAKIKERIKTLDTLKAEEMVDEIERQKDDSHKMFKAIKTIKTAKPQQVRVKDAEGNNIVNENKKVEIIKQWFEAQLTDEKYDRKHFVEDKPHHFLNPISENEVWKAIKQLKSNKSTGPDEIPNELLKNAGRRFVRYYTYAINKSITTGDRIEEIGQGNLIPLPKPNKESGPVSNLRPIILLNGVRKILSIVALRRVEAQIDNYTGPWQHGFKRGQSCADIVWCQKIMTSVVMKKQWRLHKMGIDMSKAFDTIKRDVVLKLLNDAGCTKDDIVIVKMLITNTSLRVKLNKTESAEFATTLGSFQGDSLSGKLFTLYLAGALNNLRATLEKENPPISKDMMPTEMEYADDCDFFDTDANELKDILPKINKIFSDWNLKVNQEKTEFTDIEIATAKNKKGLEKWRDNKILGTKLCSTKDTVSRINLANAAFSKYRKAWLNGKKITLKTKIRIYEAQVVSVLMYNSCTWAVPKAIMDKVDTCQRKHLRNIMKVKWPTKITNDKLYNITETTKISERVKKARWKMIGNVMRQPEQNPAHCAMVFAFKNPLKLKNKRGRPPINLIDTIIADLKEKCMDIKTDEDFEEIKNKSKDAKYWNSL